MSILIDMKMPEKCLECPLYDNYNYYCTLYSFGIPARHNRDGSTRPEWCELKELPKCEDAVSRQAAIKDVESWVAVDEYEKHLQKNVVEWLKEFPSAQPEQVCIANITLTDEQVKEAVEKANNAIISVIEPEQQWIPCSERLPKEKEKSYWVCLETGDQCQCRWTNDMYGLGVNKWSKWGWHIMDKPQYSKVVAWMPLPSPYQSEE